MQINFSRENSFVAEVAAQKEVGGLPTNIVRMERERDGIDWYLKAGFVDVLENLYVLTKSCGREPPDRNCESGAQVAQAAETFLREQLEKLKVEVREGQFVG